jgi:hypothetical protein
VGDEVLSLHYTLPKSGNYTSVRLIIDVFHGGWSTKVGPLLEKNKGRYNLVWFVRDYSNYN